MSLRLVFSLLLACVLVFWVLGAYNRLVRLRRAVAQAWVQAEAPLNRRAQLLPELSAWVLQEMPQEQAALAALAQAQEAVAQAARSLQTSPVSATAAASLVANLARLDASLARLQALCEMHAGLREQATVQTAMAEWRELEGRLVFGRQLYNDAVQIYNDAVAEFPTRWLVGWFKFLPGGRL